MSKQRPILFSGPMVRAILEGRKTQTRRVIKPQPAETTDKVVMAGDGSCEVKFFSTVANGIYLSSDNWRKCPYGQPGDLLWVRETLRRSEKGLWLYAADDNPVLVSLENQAAMLVWAHHKEGNVCQSIFMPRWASRITLEVTAVRVEQVQDISEADAIAEGFNSRDELIVLWNKINGKTYPWESNPFVWVVEFNVQK